MGNHHPHAVGRRRFVGYVLGGTTLMAAADLGLLPTPADAVPSLPQIPELYDLEDLQTDAARPTAHLITIEINPDGSATFALPRMEVGQGITTSSAMIIAEELDLPVEKVHVSLAKARPELVFNPSPAAPTPRSRPSGRTLPGGQLGQLRLHAAVERPARVRGGDHAVGVGAAGGCRRGRRGASGAAVACAYTRATGQMPKRFPINHDDPIPFEVKPSFPPAGVADQRPAVHLLRRCHAESHLCPQTARPSPWTSRTTSDSCG